MRHAHNRRPSGFGVLGIVMTTKTIPIRPGATPVSDSALETQWPRFTEEVHARLLKGARAYGDGSFSKSPAKLCEEIRQELDDVMGWGFILWCRLQKISEAANKAKIV